MIPFSFLGFLVFGCFLLFGKEFAAFLWLSLETPAACVQEQITVISHSLWFLTLTGAQI